MVDVALEIDSILNSLDREIASVDSDMKVLSETEKEVARELKLTSGVDLISYLVKTKTECDFTNVESLYGSFFADSKNLLSNSLSSDDFFKLFESVYTKAKKNFTLDSYFSTSHEDQEYLKCISFRFLSILIEKNREKIIDFLLNKKFPFVSDVYDSKKNDAIFKRADSPSVENENKFLQEYSSILAESEYYFTRNHNKRREDKSFLFQQEIVRIPNIYSEIIISKVVNSIILPFNDPNCGEYGSNDISEFYNTMTKYLAKAMDNFEKMISFNTTLDSNLDLKNSLLISTFSGILGGITTCLENSRNILEKSLETVETTMTIMNVIYPFLKHLKKGYNYNIYKYPNFIDSLFSNMSESFFKSLVLAYKNFSSDYIDKEVAKLIEVELSSLSSSNDSYEHIYMITKENFKLAYYCKDSTRVKDLITESYFFSVNRMIKVFRSFFTIAQKNRRGLIFVINILAKYTSLLSKLHDQTTTLSFFSSSSLEFDSEHRDVISLVTTNYLSSTTELTKLLDTYVNLLSKDLLSNPRTGLESLLNLISSATPSTSKEEVQTFFTEASKILSEFVNEVHISKITNETESLIFNFFTQLFTSKLKESIDKVLKRKENLTATFKEMIAKVMDLLTKLKSNRKLNVQTHKTLEKNVGNFKLHLDMLNLS